MERGQPISIIRMEEGIREKLENYYYLPDCSEKDTDSINRGGMIQPIGCHFLTEDDEKVWNDNWINSSFNVCTRNGMGRGKLCSG